MFKMLIIIIIIIIVMNSLFVFIMINSVTLLGGKAARIRISPSNFISFSQEKKRITSR